MIPHLWKFLPLAVAIVLAIALAVPAHAARQVAGPSVVVKKTNKALVASP